MAVTYQNVIQVAPEFKPLSESPAGILIINEMISLATTFVCVAKWGTIKGEKAITYLAAHFLKELGFSEGVNGGGADASVTGPITQEKVGDLSRSYGALNLGANANVQDNLFSTTAYGKIFVALRRTVVSTPRVT